MLAAGQGTAPDHNEAARWYRKAADQGHAAAQSNLGRCYERGEGVTASPVLASQWYRKSADQGHAAAEYNLGRLYQTGSGVFKDVDKARALFQSAAGHGNVSAAYALGVMYESGTGVPQSNAQAAYWYRIAAAKTDPGLSTASQQRIRSFLANDGLQVFRRERLNVGSIGELRIGHDRSRVRVDQDDLVALGSQCLAGLGSGVVKLAALADDDGSGADKEDFLNRGVFRHAPGPF